MMKEVPDGSVDLIFTDLPYGQTSCDWDTKIDLEKMWEHFMRVKKTHTPLFFCCTTKFGVELINSAPKKCPFRYDIVWVKSAPCGFLSARKMPMKKHEMLYVFYEKLPLYDLSSHARKSEKAASKNVIKGDHNTYNTEGRKKPIVREEGGKYDPPLPVSVVKEEKKYERKKGMYQNRSKAGETATTYDPPLPNSILEIKSQRGKHSTQKPTALMKWVLKYYSKEGDVVLDPTMGSGSTGVACNEMNREFVGIEMDPEIYESALDRLED